jgi:serine/threonine protein kinase
MAVTKQTEGEGTGDFPIEGLTPAEREAPSPRLVDDPTTAKESASASGTKTWSGDPDPDAGGRRATQVSTSSGDAESGSGASPRRQLGVIPGFTLLRRLGGGGAGEVFLARDEWLRRDVALKMIRPAGGETSDTRTRARVEGEEMARIDHPRVVRVFASGVHAGQRYLVMEYVPGGSLAERLGDRPWPSPSAASIIEGVAQGVAAAHARGLVHRDLKPANILLDAEGRPKVADFGLAKLLDDSPTRTEAVLGTPAYMAPEQVGGASSEVGPAADVYALGTILYELLTGRPPFQGATTLATLDLVREAEPVPPRLFHPNITHDLETVCLTCLRKDPRHRYPDAAALADDLARVRAGDPIRARVPSLLKEYRMLRKTRRWTAALIGVGLALAAMFSITPLTDVSRLPGVVAFWAVMLAILRPCWYGVAAASLVVGSAWAVAGMLGADTFSILGGSVWDIGVAGGLAGGAQFAARRSGRSALEALSGVLFGGFCGFCAYLTLLNLAASLLAHRPSFPRGGGALAMLAGAFTGALAYGPVSARLDLRRLRLAGRVERDGPTGPQQVDAKSSIIPTTIDYGDRAPADTTAELPLVHAPPPWHGTAQPAAPLWPRIDGLEVLSALGSGGMGVVLLARQAGFDRLVALKLIRPEGRGAAELRERFFVEGRAAARLNHPGIVRVYELGESAGQLYAALEYLPGGTLAWRLRGRPLPTGEAAELAEALARAVAAAHRAGVVHRDLKPANILLDAEGRPKVADFGLAKLLDAADGQTRTHAVLGTPSYMAPEQAWGRSRTAGPAADVYALGAILYELLTGRPPFKGTTPAETLDMVRRQDVVPPRRLQPGLPRDLEAVCLKCLEKDPRRRYADASTLADDLRRVLGREPTRARPPGLIRRLWTVRMRVDRRSSETLRVSTIVISLGVSSVVHIATGQLMFGIGMGLVIFMALYFWDRRRL